MDAQMEALKRKRQASPGITIICDDPESVTVQGRDGKEMSSEEDQRENPDVAPGVYDKGKDADQGDGLPVSNGEPALAVPGGKDSAREEDLPGDMDPAQIFDEPETMRRKADGQGKPRSLTDRAAFAAFKGRKK